MGLTNSVIDPPGDEEIMIVYFERKNGWIATWTFFSGSDTSSKNPI